MTDNEIIEKLTALHKPRAQALENLIIPARAAANMLKDMKMDRTAEPLLEALFKLDAIEQECADFLREHPEAVIVALAAARRRAQP